jgi:hypothetical protein
VPRLLRSVDPCQWVVAAAVAVVALIGRLAGTTFDTDPIAAHPLVPTWQLLDLSLLRHHLLGSLAVLHMQPPLYNLAIGLLLRLPGALQVPVAEVVLFACAAASAALTLASMSLLGVPRAFALGVTLVFVVLDPAQFLYAMTPFYVAPTAALMTGLGYLAIRMAQAPTAATAAAFAACGAVLALWTTLWQPLVFLGLLVLTLMLLPADRRALAKGMAVPAAALVAWSLHTTVSFGTPMTSTWLGMNLARVTVYATPRETVDDLVHQGRLPPIATVHPFAALSVYRATPDRSGPPALTQVTKADRSPNENNRAYIGVSRLALADDLRFIALEPRQYAVNVFGSLSLWFTPADQYFTLHAAPTATYRAIYDRYVAWQPAPYEHPDGRHIPTSTRWSRLSVFALAVWGCVLVGVPTVVAVTYRRRHHRAVGLVLLWLLVTVPLVVTSLTEYGENNRLRFEVGTAPITLSAVVVATAARALGARRRAEARRLPSGVGAG